METKPVRFKDGDFFMVSDEWWKRLTSLSPYTRVVAIQLSQHRNRKTGDAFPGVKLLAEECRFNRKTVIKAVKELNEAGFISKHRRGPAGANVHHFTMPQYIPPDGTYKSPTGGDILKPISPVPFPNKSRPVPQYVPPDGLITIRDNQKREPDSRRGASAFPTPPPSKSQKPKRKKTKPHPEHQQTIRFWTDTYQDELREKYPFNGAKDANLIAILLKRNSGAVIREHISGYLSAWERCWWHKDGSTRPTIGALSTHFGEIVPKEAPPPPLSDEESERQFAEDMKRMEEKIERDLQLSIDRQKPGFYDP